jgi:cysteinyl-tRNA synthetase
MLELYNTLTRKTEKFKPISQDWVKIYSCGPTVYNYAHIGNHRAYLFEDTVVRSLRFLGYKVKTTMNITDIDDKTIRDSQKQGQKLGEFTRKYTELFLQDLAFLRIIPADTIAPISWVIPEMIQIIQVLLDRGFAYLAEDGSVYYSIRKFKTYWELANLDTSGMKESVRINNDEYTKDTAADFALWKGYDEKFDGENFWDAEFLIPGKKGEPSEKKIVRWRPGWHIECSACNHKHFWDQIDIHMGGMDLVFPHHQNEIAQTEAFTGKKFSTYWLHCGHLLVEGKKMSKSAWNFYTLHDICAKYPTIQPSEIARAFRLLSLGVQYRENFNFTLSSLDASRRTLDGIDACLKRLWRITQEGKFRKNYGYILQEAMLDFVEYLEDDFNVPEALARTHLLITAINTEIDSGEMNISEKNATIDLLKSFDAVLGVFDFSLLEAQEVPEEVIRLIEERNLAKQSKDWKLADELRDAITTLGYKAVDTKEGTIAERI